MIWETSDDILAFDRNKLLIVYGNGKQTDPVLYTKWLTTEEIDRAGRIRSEGERNNWIACHVTLRQILAKWLGLKPGAVEFRRNNFGKMFVANSNLYFNLSHTTSSFILGFNMDGKIGVDLEYLSGHEDLPLLIEYAFSQQETNLCMNGNITEIFLKIWTLKEAYLKAAGVGLVDQLKSFNVIGITDNDILLKQFSQSTFVCPNGETASVVYRNDKTIEYIWLK